MFEKTVLEVGDKIVISQKGSYHAKIGKIIGIEPIPARNDGMRLIHCHLNEHPGITRHMECDVMFVSRTLSIDVEPQRDVDKYLDEQRDDIFRKMSR